MNCYKCGKEMRVVPEQVATDEKGLPIYHRIGYCDSCMSKFDIDILEQQKNQTVQNNQKPPKKKQSTLSTLAAVFSILTFTLPVAVILAIIDIATGDKKNKLHTGSWFAIIWCVLAIIVYNIGNKPGDDVTIPIAEVKVSVESTEEQAPEPIINKSDTVISPGYTFDADGLQVTINDFDLDFTDYEDEYGWNTPADGMKYIMIDVSYQNNSKDDKYVSIYDFQCYADNTDCEQNYLMRFRYLKQNCLDYFFDYLLITTKKRKCQNPSKHETLTLTLNRSGGIRTRYPSAKNSVFTRVLDKIF